MTITIWLLFSLYDAQLVQHPQTYRSQEACEEVRQQITDALSLSKHRMACLKAKVVI